MAKGVMMPKQGITVESCILTEWKVKVGDTVKVGDVLFSYETDKSSFDQESEFEGEVLALLCADGDEVPVLQNVCIIGAKGEDISALTGGAAPAPAAPAPVAEAAPVAAPAPAAAPVATNAKGVMMPKQGITVESCILTEWKVKVGDAVKVGDVLFSYETDKASFDQESEFEGEVLALLCEAGEEVPVLQNVCVIGAKGDDISCFLAGNAPVAAPAAEAAPAPAAAQAPAAAPVATASAPKADGDRIFASPRAKNLAKKMGVDLSDAIPTGPNGRIVEADIRVASTKPKAEAAPAPVAQAPAAAPADLKAFTDEKMPNIRKVIAKNMMNSLSSMAQLTHTLTFDCTNVMDFRAYLKANAEKLNLPNITINDIIIFAVSRVIKNHKVLNAHLLNGDTMRYFEHANIGIATDAPKGLLVPVLNGADTMSLSEISANAKKLTKGAQTGTISPELLSGGSFTISNLGTMGIESFTPVINPPQTGILGVNTFETRIKLGKNGEIIPYTAMGLSLTYDHRALDGAPASRFLKELKEYLESFSLNLVVDSKGL